MCDNEPIPAGRDVWNNVNTFTVDGNTTHMAIEFGELNIKQPIWLTYYYCHAHPIWIKN